jgi:flagellar basal-body rod protein FlgF
MDNAGYTALTRQSGLMRELQVIAHNIANISTTGFRREGLIFSEFVQPMAGAEEAMSMALGNTHQTYLTQGGFAQTGGSFDFAVQGEGFFLLSTPDGDRLTRAGSFMPNATGELVNSTGDRLLDASGAAIFIPPDARTVHVAQDGTMSADGSPIGQIGLVRPVAEASLAREAGTMFSVSDDAYEPVPNGQVMQGFLEESNVEPVTEIARMIAVQRAYEMGQKFMDREDERMRGVIQTLGRQS